MPQGSLSAASYQNSQRKGMPADKESTLPGHSGDTSTALMPAANVQTHGVVISIVKFHRYVLPFRLLKYAKMLTFPESSGLALAAVADHESQSRT